MTKTSRCCVCGISMDDKEAASFDLGNDKVYCPFCWAFEEIDSHLEILQILIKELRKQQKTVKTLENTYEK